MSSARRSVWLMGGGVALVVVAAVAGLVSVKTGAESPAAVAPPAKKLPPPEIVIYVADLPADASLSIDGQPTAAPIHLPRRPGEKHVITARAPGYIDHDVDFTADNDMTISIGLERVTPPATPAPAPVSAAAPARKPKPRPKASEFRALPDEPPPARGRR